MCGREKKLLPIYILKLFLKIICLKMKIEIEEAYLKELQNHSAMLSQICALVEDFCPTSNTTTVEAVQNLLDAYSKDYNLKKSLKNGWEKIDLKF